MCKICQQEQIYNEEVQRFLLDDDCGGGFTKDYIAICEKCKYKDTIKIASHISQPSYFKCSKCQEMNYNKDDEDYDKEMEKIKNKKEKDEYAGGDSDGDKKKNEDKEEEEVPTK